MADNWCRDPSCPCQREQMVRSAAANVQPGQTFTVEPQQLTPGGPVHGGFTVTLNPEVCPTCNSNDKKKRGTVPLPKPYREAPDLAVRCRSPWHWSETPVKDATFSNQLVKKQTVGAPDSDGNPTEPSIAKAESANVGLAEGSESREANPVPASVESPSGDVDPADEEEWQPQVFGPGSRGSAGAPDPVPLRWDLNKAQSPNWSPEDLDRCIHGRHSIDNCFYCIKPTNKFLMAPSTIPVDERVRIVAGYIWQVRIGTAVHGTPIWVTVRDAPRVTGG